MKIPLAQLAKRATNTRRKRIILRPINPTQVQANALAAIYLRTVNLWRDGSANFIMPAYEATLSEIMRDSVGDVEAAISQTENGFVRVLLDFTRLFTGWAVDFQLWHMRRFISNIKYAANVDLSTLIGPEDSRTTIEQMLARNVALIRDISDQARGRISDIVFRGLQNRTPAQEVSKKISEAIGLSRKRALRIASDQTVKLSSALDLERQQQVGMTQFEWIHSGKAHPRPEHVARNGKIFEWSSEVGREDPPGYAPFCFPSGEPISIYSDVFRFWRRLHSGHLTTFITDQGISVNCTPNHPVLTSSGWKAAKDLKVGDDVFNVGPSGFNGFQVDVKQTQTSIGNLFKTLQSIFGFVSINGGGGEFHGDTSVDEIIDVVTINGGLRDSFKSMLDEDLVEILLEKSLMVVPLLLGCRSLKTLSNTGNGIGSGGMGSINLLASLLLAHLPPDEMRGDALISEVNSAFVEHMGEAVTRNSQSVADRLEGLPGNVSLRCGLVIVLMGLLFRLIDSMSDDPKMALEALDDRSLADFATSGDIKNGLPFGQISRDRISQIDTKEWSGHVYNLETSTGWFAIASLAVHNCGCKAKGVLNLDD